MTSTTPIASRSWPFGSLSWTELERSVREKKVCEIMLAVPDPQGRLLGKYFNPTVFLNRMTDGAEMCSYILATDTDMNPLDGFDLTGWEQGFGDFLVKPERDTARILPTRSQSVLVLGTPVLHDNAPVTVAPRHMLTTQLQRLREHGYEVKVGVESEFLLYTNRRSGRRPAWSGSLDYGLTTPPLVRSFLSDLGVSLTDAGITWEAFKAEGAGGQVEVTFAYGNALTACDDYTIYRHMIGDIAGTGLDPVFMAAPETGIGSGLHLHLSLWTPDGRPCFAHQRDTPLPTVMDQSVGGLMAVLPDVAPLYAPTVNSWKRYRPHSFAPLRYNWGIDNRGCAVRVTGHGDHTRLEIRTAGADANIYHALASYIAAITHGIEEKLTAPEACATDAYEDLGAMPLYGDLGEALTHFEGSLLAPKLIGSDVVRHYTRLTRAELLWHCTHVTDIERLRATR